MRNVMTGILYAAGPVSTRLTVKNLSSAFNLAVTKIKFMSAAKQLEAANMGTLVLLESISRTAYIFVKRSPGSAQEILEMNQNRDLSSASEYEHRYHLPSPSTITERMQEHLVKQGYVPDGIFKKNTTSRSSGPTLPQSPASPQQPRGALPGQPITQQQQHQQMHYLHQQQLALQHQLQQQIDMVIPKLEHS